MGFRPEDNRPSAEDDQRREEERAKRGPGWVPAGTFVFAFVNIGIKETKGGAKRLNARARVLDTEPNLKQHVGHEFWIGCGLNMSSDGQRALLGRICGGMGLTNEDEFEPTNAKQLRRALLHRPMVSEIKYKKNGDYHNNEWGRIYQQDALQQATVARFADFRRELIDEFGDPAQEENDDSNGSSHGGDPGPGDEDAPPGRWF